MRLKPVSKYLLVRAQNYLPTYLLEKRNSIYIYKKFLIRR